MNDTDRNIVNYRQVLQKAKRVVIKVGTNVLVDKHGRPNSRRINLLVKDIAAIRADGREVLLVSSGAIAAGLPILKMKRRPTALSSLQMAAAVGQTRLLELYNRYFLKQKLSISQVLLTHADLKDRGRHLNARNTILALLRHQIIPVINENDVVAVDEIKIGDNDMLSALVSILIDADLLIILTTPNGLQRSLSNNQFQRVPYLDKVDKQAFALVSGKTNALSTGGMASKLEAVKLARQGGAQVVIASGKETHVLTRIMNAEDKGTLIGCGDPLRKLRKRKGWISYFHRVQGSVHVDQGAISAIQQHGKSLLPSGIKSVTGKFVPGSLIEIKSIDDHVIGHGLTEYSHHEIAAIRGHHSRELSNILGQQCPQEVIHRDNLIVF